MTKSSHASRVVILLILAFLTTCSGGSSDTSRGQAAADGLTTLRSMARDEGFDFYGYESAGDIGQEVIGDPIEQKCIDTGALLQRITADDSLIVGCNQFLYPVMVKGKPIGSILVMMTNGAWEYIAIGSKLTIEEALNILSVNHIAVSDAYLLDLDEIEMAFVGYKHEGRDILIPLYASDFAPFVPGVKYAFAQLAPYIKAAVIEAQASYLNMVPSAPGTSGETRSQTVPSQALSRSAFRVMSESAEATNKMLNVHLYPQEQDQWCWAAAGKMTMLFAGGDSKTVTQCAEADNAFGQSSCCNNGETKQCNQPHYPLYENWGFAAREVFKDDGAALSWADLKGLIDAGKPVAFLWKWNSGGGHYMVAVGYHEDLTATPVKRLVHIHDPWPPEVGEKKSITYKNWVGGSAYDHLQTCYYYNIAKK